MLLKYISSFSLESFCVGFTNILFIICSTAFFLIFGFVSWKKELNGSVNLLFISLFSSKASNVILTNWLSMIIYLIGILFVLFFFILILFVVLPLFVNPPIFGSVEFILYSLFNNFCFSNSLLANNFSYLFITDDFKRGKVSVFSLNFSSSKIIFNEYKYEYLKLSTKPDEFKYLFLLISKTSFFFH